jgi:glycosyltransferase involved in cell wall biosynthesis
VAPAGRLVVVENGIGPTPPSRPRDAVRADLGERPDAVVCLAVGSLTRQKAHEVLLRAVAHARRRGAAPRLWIAGDGPRRGELESLARQLDVAADVRLLGRRGDVHDLMGAADVFVLSSRREGLSITLLEALRAGRAALVTDAGGSADAVEHAHSGWVVPVEDPEALGEAMAMLVADPALRGRLGDAGRQRWSERFTADRMVAQTERLYRELLREHGRAAAAEEEGDGRVVA